MTPAKLVQAALIVAMIPKAKRVPRNRPLWPDATGEHNRREDDGTEGQVEERQHDGVSVCGEVQISCQKFSDHNDT